MQNLNLYNINDLLNEAMLDIRNPPEGIAIEGWHDFNEFTGGLRPHEFTIFCGATGVGKSQFLCNIIASLIKQNVKTFCAPVETGAVDFVRRIFSIYGKFDFNTGAAPTLPMLKNLGEVVSENMVAFQDNLRITTYDNRVDVNEMILNLKYMVEVHGVKVALLDNLNFFMKPTKASDAILEYDEVVHNFVMLAKKIPIHIFLVMHPKKTEHGKVMSEFDIKGSSTAVQEASNILLMNRLNKDEIGKDGLTEFHREFVFKKIRRRGFYVGRNFYLFSKNGKYIHHDTTRDEPSHQNEAGRSTGFKPIRSSSLPYAD